jgi:hypothetical protein
MSKTSAVDLYDLLANDKSPEKTRCRACGRLIGNYFAGRAKHGRMHVRLKEAEEIRLPNGYIGFLLTEKAGAHRAF